ncbi:MAG: DUF2905 domain-containing protein [Candidatus Omnitrophota bacterium]
MLQIGRLLITLGIVFIVAGIIFYFLPKIIRLPRLPGDIFIQKENFTFYFPITTSIIVSIILSLIFWLWSKR